MVRITAIILATLLFTQVRALGSFMQLRGQAQRAALDLGTGDESCADLNNQGAYFSIKVSIGTPMKGTKPQEFELVADTGSDSLIVTSCVCVKNQYCDARDKCFQGTNRSSSFVLKEYTEKRGNETTKSPMGISMTFGSGTVRSVIATDIVKVAGQATTLQNGVLLMVDQRELDISGRFEGILGLGPPDRTNTNAKSYKHRRHVEVMRAKDSQSESGDPKNESDSDDSEDSGSDDHPSDSGSLADGHNYAPRLFLQKAGVERYTLCFNDAGKPGAMRVNVPEFRQPLPTIGQFHWGLGLYGISIGDENAEPLVCHGKNMHKGQSTPCGAIPDSGTTLLMGPEDHILKMYDSLCDKWDRCNKAQKNTTGEYSELNMTKHHAFQKLLYNCADWKHDGKGIEEVPSVFFNVGAAGNKQKLEITPWAYIVETEEEVMKYHKRYLFGVVPVDVPEPTGKFKKVCVANFGVQRFDTDANGPVWIMGHPLFYQYRVGYSLGAFSKNPDSFAPMRMAFEKGKCGSCSDNKASLLSTSERQTRPMRYSNEPPAVRQYDTSLPM